MNLQGIPRAAGTETVTLHIPRPGCSCSPTSWLGVGTLCHQESWLPALALAFTGLQPQGRCLATPCSAVGECRGKKLPPKAKPLWVPEREQALVIGCPGVSRSSPGGGCAAKLSQGIPLDSQHQTTPELLGQGKLGIHLRRSFHASLTVTSAMP